MQALLARDVKPLRGLPPHMRAFYESGSVLTLRTLVRTLCVLEIHYVYP